MFMYVYVSLLLICALKIIETAPFYLNQYFRVLRGWGTPQGIKYKGYDLFMA